MIAKVVFVKTFKRMVRNKKNRLVWIIAFLGVLIYSGLILPNTEPMDTVDMERLEIDLLGNQGLMKAQFEAGSTEANNYTGLSTYGEAKNKFEQQRAFKIAVDTGNVRQYIQLNYLPEDLSKEIMDDYLKNSEEPMKDLHYDQSNKRLRLNSYLEEIPAITFHLVQEKTAWQQIHLFFLNWGPLIILILTVFLVSDVTTGEREARTQKAGIPYNWRKYLWVQSMAAFCFVCLFFAVVFIWFFLVNGILFGFGSLDLKVPLYTYSSDYTTNDAVFGLMEIGTFLIKVFPFLVLFIYVMVRLSVLFSLLFKNDVVVLTLGVFAVVFEKLYYSRRMRDILGIDLSFFPQTYIDFGKVVSGEKNFLLNTSTITMDRGLLVMVGTVLVIESLLVLATKFIHRQRFVR